MTGVRSQDRGGTIWQGSNEGNLPRIVQAGADPGGNLVGVRIRSSEDTRASLAGIAVKHDLVLIVDDGVQHLLVR